MLIHRPILSNFDFFLFRLQGPGFGNLMFPLYRAFQNQVRYGGELIFPQFRQLKIGPYLRKEKDKRTYGEIFSSRSTRDIWLQARSHFQHKIQETQLAENFQQLGNEHTVVHYVGLRNYFKDLDTQCREAFLQLLLTRAQSGAHISAHQKEITSQHVAIHLRLGDFSTVVPGQAKEQQMSARTDIEWYGRNVDLLRANNKNLKFTLFTDEGALPQAYLARLGNPMVDTSANALEAILCMSSHPVIIGSKSSFTLWASYLGQSELRLPKEFDIGRYATSREIRHVSA